MDVLISQMKQDVNTISHIKTPAEIAKMREAGRISAEILDALDEYVKPGVTTRQLDKIANDLVVKTYHAEIDRADLEGHVFSSEQAVFFSLNHVIARGECSDIPLKKGDILGVDLSIRKDDYCGDTQKMWIVGGDTSSLARRLLSVAYQAMWVGVNHVKAGVHLGTIAHAVQTYVEGEGFSMVKFPGLTGHTIGKVHCEGLFLPFYGEPNTGHILQEGMVLTIEPFICAGSGEAKLLPNIIRTAVNKDNSLAAYWEHVVAVTKTGCEILDLRVGESEHPG